jgi:RsiW-degrading membrane proteinase PrsW (M82 family)
MTILFVAFAPIILILVFIYYRDKYEKEPMGLLLKSLVAGAIITVPILIVEIGLGELVTFQEHQKIPAALYNGFVVAAFTEELFKFLAFFIIIWRNRNFNELFDGIIYAVYISLGFAAIENILYVLGHGGGVGILRAFTAVPAHALFGITMGFYFGLARFNPEKVSRYLWLAILMPILLHGFYDFILMSENGYLLLLFIPFLVYLWIAGFRKMKAHSRNSVFKDGIPKEEISVDLGEEDLQN